MSASSLPLPLSGRARPLRSPELMVTVAAAAALGALLGDGVDWQVALALAAIAALAVLGLLHPFAFLLAFLFVRPLLDGMADNRFHTPVGSLNVAGLLALVLIWTTVATITSQRQAIRPPGVRAFAFVLLVSGLAAVLALARYRAVVGTLPIAEFVRLLTLLAVYVLAANLARATRRVWLIAAAAGLSAVAPAMIGIVQWIGGTPHAADLTISRIQSTFTGPNALAMYLGLAAIALVGVPDDILPRKVRGAALALVVVALAGTFSRSGWVMLILGGTAFAWRANRRAVLMALVAAALIAVAVPSIRGRVVPGFGPVGAGSSRWIPSSYQWRVDTWKALLQTYAKRPLTGYGLRTAPFVDPRKGPSSTAEGYDPHNTPIKLLVEGGPALLLAWGILFVALVGKMRTLARRRWEGRDAARLALVLWSVTIFIGLTADDPLAGTALLYALLAITGAVAGAATWRRQVPARADGTR